MIIRVKRGFSEILRKKAMAGMCLAMAFFVMKIFFPEDAMGTDVRNTDILTISPLDVTALSHLG